jgi:hypothetical protein
MADSDYRRALDAACREWERLSAERVALDARLTDLQRSIATLTRLCGLVPTVPFGLAEACRLVLARDGRPRAARDIRADLEAIGFDFSRHANPLASIHVTLKRLVEAGEVSQVSTGSKPFYVWRGPVRGRGAEAVANAAAQLARKPQARRKGR